ncbi:MAG: hypothetical protein OHK0022_42950 [Roseiflexaceae bacterium]
MKLGQTIAQNQPALHQALLEIGTVHFARFVALDRSKPNLKFDPANPGSNTGYYGTADAPVEVYVIISTKVIRITCDKKPIKLFIHTYMHLIH